MNFHANINAGQKSSIEKKWNQTLAWISLPNVQHYCNPFFPLLICFCYTWCWLLISFLTFLIHNSREGRNLQKNQHTLAILQFLLPWSGEWTPKFFFSFTRREEERTHALRVYMSLFLCKNGFSMLSNSRSLVPVSSLFHSQQHNPPDRRNPILLICTKNLCFMISAL